MKPLLTTTIGAYPKPSYTPVPNWADLGFKEGEALTEKFDYYLASLDNNDDAALDRATQEVVQEQVRLGIDIPTDGEIRREHYIFYHCRHVSGISFEALTPKILRGYWPAQVPTVTGPIHARAPFLVRDWQIAQQVTEKSVKMTLPGPLTVTDSLANQYYQTSADFARAWADSLNVEIRRLADAGCHWIQIDEPVFARQVDAALSFGVECLERCFANVPDHVQKVVHICCGYPAGLDDDRGTKADPQAYFHLADSIEDSVVSAVSIEDAHCHNDLTLLERYRKTTIILGTIDIAKSEVEPAETIAGRLHDALEHIDAKRLMVAPDCGLVMLPRALAMQKLSNMVTAANMVRSKINKLA